MATYGEPGKNPYTVPGVGGILSNVVDSTTGITQIYRQGAFNTYTSLGTYNPSTGKFTPFSGTDPNATRSLSNQTGLTNIKNASIKTATSAGALQTQAQQLIIPNTAPPRDAPARTDPPAARESTTTQSDTSISKPLEDQSLFSTSTGASEILKYPLNNDGGYDFLKITTHELNRSEDLLRGSAKEPFKLKSPEDNLSNPIGNYIALPMQPGISDSNSVDWGADQLNPLQLAGARVAGGMMGNLAKLDLGGAGKEAMARIKSSLEQAGLTLTPNDITSYFAGEAVGANIFTRSTGKVINPNLELLFRGPQLRTFNYSYRFTPREDKESKVIKQIIRHFKKHMAARRNNVGLFLKTPYVFKLTYVYSQGGQHPFLNKIKPCALTNFNVDYTPDGSYATYTDGSMTSYTVSMQFSEIAPIYEDDYKDTDNDMGY